MDVCIHCDEEVDEYAHEFANGPKAHPECFVRMFAGGVNHQRGTCICQGGPNEPDEPNLTVRQAAIAAAYYLYARAEAGLPPVAPNPTQEMKPWLN